MPSDEQPEPTEPEKQPEKPPKAPSRSRDRLPLILIGGVFLAALIVGGVLLLTTGGSDSSSTGGLPSPDDVSPAAALVIHVPKSLGEVTESELGHALDQTAAASGLKETPSSASPKYDELRKSALNGLLEMIWLQGQAREMGIVVTPAQVSAELERLKKSNFKDEAEYQRFLDSSHYTDEDVAERVRAQILARRVQQRVAAAAPNKAAGQKSFTKFAVDFQHRWRSRTVCAPDLAIEQCSNGEPEASGSGQGEGEGTIPGAEPPG